MSLTTLDKIFIRSSVTVCRLELKKQALPTLEFVRWRKPRWVPRAKSKEFVLPKRQEYDPQESEWLRTTENHYRTQMKAIWQLIKLIPDQSLPNPSKKKADKEKMATASWQEMQDRMKYWNSRVAVTREEAENKMFQEKEDRLMGIIQQDHIIQQQFSEETLRRLKREKEVGFITPDNVEERLVECLEMTSDYDFAIDRDGVRVISLQDTETEKSGKKSEKTFDIEEVISVQQTDKQPDKTD
ncbi:probable 28S ribosomal protein S26, mitochondrial [Ostrea edulis]|uniref:probable 28S ribosomal protein S26, mitochondrial n=1 Tax=Ostrea edulis TaxID=37623 RepID=UPI0024AF87B4|nr:probable 28S ribosomal protein S26, mitochondrial [Ostrea edulis]